MENKSGIKSFVEAFAMKTRRCIIIMITAALILSGLSGCDISLLQKHESNPGITRFPSAVDLGRGKLTTIPAYDIYKPGFLQVDLRSYDLTANNLKERYSDLIHADFDMLTKWPYALPVGFDPKKIFKYGKNPGLNIHSLHKEGVTGSGVGIAIIGSALLTDHIEYRDRLMLYEELDCRDETATVAGCAAVSVAAGKSTGVAPGASIYYIACTLNNESEPASDNTSNTSAAEAINRIIEINRTLPQANKIRVLLISEGWDPADTGNENAMKAIEMAKQDGIFVITDSLPKVYDHEMDYKGLGRDPLADPDETASYVPGNDWAGRFFLFQRYTRAREALLVPMDSRCTASPIGHNDYAFYRTGDPVMAPAYIAGLYALACQVRPDTDPQLFWEKALETGGIVIVKNDNIEHEYKLKKIVDPLELIHGLS